jgi:hypothetical protein
MLADERSTREEAVAMVNDAVDPCGMSSGKLDMFRKTLVAAALGLAAFQASAALTTQQYAADTLVHGLVNDTSVFVSGAPSASGLPTSVAGFTDSNTANGLGFSNAAGVTANGVVLTTGITGDSGCVRSGPGSTESTCTSPIGSGLGLQSMLSFRFTTSTAGHLSFQYVFASEEYGPGALNDFATFSLVRVSDGIELDTFDSALKSVDQVNCTTNATQFVGNNPGDLTCGGDVRDVEFDGLTTSLLATSSALLRAGVVYQMTFTINDTPDGDLDSALFLLNGSFTVAGGDPNPNPIPEPASWGLAGVGLLLATGARRCSHQGLKR